jgi:hypothetical protein
MLTSVMLSLAGDDAMSKPSHADDGAVESCWRWHCRGDLAVAKCRCRVMLTTVPPSHVDDGTTEVTWPWCDTV